MSISDWIIKLLDQYSRQNCFDGLGVFGDHGNRARADAVLPFDVDACRLVDRRHHIARPDLAIRDRFPIVVSFAVHGPASDSAAAQGTGPGAGKMIAADVLVNVRRTAK